MYNDKDRLESNSNYDKCIERIKARAAKQKEQDRFHDMIMDEYGSYTSYIFRHNIPSRTDNSETCGRKDYTAREIAEVLLGSITY